MEPILLGPGEGERHVVGASEVVLKATGADTGGAVFLSETTLAPGFPGPPLHVHEQLFDMFFVLEGTLTVRLGDKEHAAAAESFVCAPPGCPHTFRNASGAPVRFLNLNTPSGFEAYMRDLGAAFADGRTPSPQEIGGIASRYDFHVV